MSTAGIRSNRGDGYQTLVAFDWALSVLSDPDFQWIEIDSVTYAVDDVVVGKADGTRICCQCKKNQIDFKVWTIADLADELDKAAVVLANDQNAEVRFYSRNPFGALAKLREHSATQPDEARYRASLSKEHQLTDADLAARLAARSGSLSTYDFLRRTSFETSSELDRMAAVLHERLRYMACNPKTAFDALWTRLDQLGCRMDGSGVSACVQHRLTKDDLKAVLRQAGAVLVPIMSLAEVRASFAGTSSIGRSWQREIAGHRIPSPVVNDLLSAIDAGMRSVLLTGLPGSGKTCVMLALQDALEQRTQNGADLVPLFIQSREFADFSSAQDRQAQGLPEQWVEKAARLAEESPVVVVIDSLDVLSIAREHNVLTYFLAQIDRLLLIPNITVVTSCRDFDRHYDRRIAERQWTCELKCQPLSWDEEIVPLLNKLEIQTTSIDAVTRGLIRNPRELALFVELAKREGSFNVVTSQALAQRYLDIIVRANASLGEPAIQAIETIADEMLKARSLAVPQQRFLASQEIQRVLCSLNVLQKTHDAKLTFGHQTLLDVLVISGALRRAITLNQFIQDLPPVPFVRPSIRSFVAQLATGERREFRKQLRTVLTGNAAFHIRRLIAESFAEQTPQDDDWSLLRDLREQHVDVFQVIYGKAARIEWHEFWFRHLVPDLHHAGDADGLTRHVHRTAQWKNEDADRILEFWTETLTLEWIDVVKIATQLPFYLDEIGNENLTRVAPLLEQLLSMPRDEHSFLGRVLARCVVAGASDDALLWRYVAGDVKEQDVLDYHLGRKLRCHYHEFGQGKNDFLRRRMEQSTLLLDLALKSIEEWSHAKSLRYGNTGTGRHRSEFLRETSYNDAHSQVDHRHVESDRVLMDAMEAAISNHAMTNSEWWQSNRERLCFSHEGALRYFALLGLTKSPEANVDIIQRMLCDKQLLQSELSYECGVLIQKAFIYLDGRAQDLVMLAILSTREEDTDDRHHWWILKERSELIKAVPCHLRSPEAQAMLDVYEEMEGSLVRRPYIGMRSGTVSAPFSYEVFLAASDKGILNLIAHYAGYQRDFDDLLVGGADQVGWQLREASSRQPIRFLNLLSTNWADLAEEFRDEIVEGAASYLAYRYGNLRSSQPWTPIDEPEASVLVRHLLDELERHPHHWQLNRAASNAIQGCAHVIQDTAIGERLVFLATEFTKLREESSIRGDSVDLMTDGINMMSGHITEALMILANNFHENGVPFPELLPHALRRLSRSGHPAIRALILHRLPYLQSKDPDLGWELFQLSMEDGVELWHIAEPCLYYAYHNHFEKVAPLLERIRREGRGKDLETWGRISSLAALSGRIDFAVWLENLKALSSAAAWEGAASVWTHPENIKQHRDQCFAGIEAGLNAGGSYAAAVAGQVDHIFRDEAAAISLPTPLVRLCFGVFESDSENKHHSFFGFEKWVNSTSYRDPEQALSSIEIYLSYVGKTRAFLYDHENCLTQLMTRLFAEAEEREESDHGAMLQRVVSVQDALLSLGVNGIDDWLKSAERQ